MEAWIKPILLVLGSIFLLRVSGRKSIAQMTMGTTVVMLALGAIIAEPLASKNAWGALLAVAALIIVLIVLEWLQMKVKFIADFINGKPVPVVENGRLNEKNLKKLRLTADKLEMRLREKGITDVTSLKFAAMEVNGELGYELIPEAKPLTVGEFKKLLQQSNLK